MSRRNARCDGYAAGEPEARSGGQRSGCPRSRAGRAEMKGCPRDDLLCPAGRSSHFCPYPLDSKVDLRQGEGLRSRDVRVRQTVHMADSTASSVRPQPRAVRDIADGYVAALADLDPILSTALGLRPGEDELPDLSPAGQDALDDLAGATLADLTAAEAAVGAAGGVVKRV